MFGFDVVGFCWHVTDTAKRVLPCMAQTACVGYGIILVVKFVLFLLGWGRRHG